MKFEWKSMEIHGFQWISGLRSLVYPNFACELLAKLHQDLLHGRTRMLCGLQVAL